MLIISQVVSNFLLNFQIHSFANTRHETRKYFHRLSICQSVINPNNKHLLCKINQRMSLVFKESGIQVLDTNGIPVKKGPETSSKG